MLILGKEFKREMLQAALLSAAAGPTTGPLAGAKLDLYTTAVPLGEDVLWEDLEIASYPGYIQQAVVWGGIHQRGDNAFVTRGGTLLFQMSDATAPINVVGYVLADAAHRVIGVEQFTEPYPLADADDALTISPEFVFGTPADYGAATVFVD